MSVQKKNERPLGFRSVPVLTDPEVAHYPEFKDFLIKTILTNFYTIISKMNQRILKFPTF